MTAIINFPEHFEVLEIKTVYVTALPTLPTADILVSADNVATVSRPLVTEAFVFIPFKYVNSRPAGGPINHAAIDAELSIVANVGICITSNS